MVFLLGLGVMMGAALVSASVAHHYFGEAGAIVAYLAGVLLWGQLVGRSRWYRALTRRANGTD